MGELRKIGLGETVRTGGNGEEGGEDYGHGEGGDVPVIGRDFLDVRTSRVRHTENKRRGGERNWEVRNLGNEPRGIYLNRNTFTYLLRIEL